MVYERNRIAYEEKVLRNAEARRLAEKMYSKETLAKRELDRVTSEYRDTVEVYERKLKECEECKKMNGEITENLNCLYLQRKKLNN